MDLPSLADILIVIILIIPGFVTFYLIKKICVIEQKFSDFETTILSVFLSLFIYIPFSFLIEVSNIDAIRDTILSPKPLSYLMTLTILFGILFGAFGRYVLLKGKVGYPGSCWEIAFKKVQEKGAYVLVYTDNNLEFKGKAHYAGKEDLPNQLIIKDPKRILRDDKMNVIEEKEWGKEILFTEDDIKRVVFLNYLDSLKDSRS